MEMHSGNSTSSTTIPSPQQQQQFGEPKTLKRKRNQSIDHDEDAPREEPESKVRKTYVFRVLKYCARNHWHTGLLCEPGFDVNTLPRHIRKQPTCNYMDEIQYDVKPYMRTILVDWLAELCDELHYSGLVLPLAMNMLDRILSSQIVYRGEYQLFGVTAFWIASKFYEKPENVPLADDCASFTANSVTPQDVIMCEAFILTMLQFDIRADTYQSVLDNLVAENHVTDSVYHLACFLSTICVREYSMLVYKPSVVACACLSLALYFLEHRDWSRTRLFVSVLGNDFIQCIRDVFRLHKEYQQSADPIVRSMYDTAKKCHVSRIEPNIDTLEVQCLSTSSSLRYRPMRSEWLADVEFLFTSDD